MKLKDTSPFVAEILEGKHDATLSAIDQATAHRRKALTATAGIRAGAKVRLKHDARNADFRGREGRVVKVNKKTISVDLECEQCGKDADVPESIPWEARCTACHGITDSVNVPSDLLEVVS